MSDPADSTPANASLPGDNEVATTDPLIETDATETVPAEQGQVWY